VNEAQLRQGICAVLMGEGFRRAHISLAIVDDLAIHELNRRFLKHDRPTDVLSFVLEQDNGFVEGEIIASAETAACVAKQFDWKPDDELLLYAIHGALHLAGYDDQSAAAKRTMRQRERFYLQQFGLNPRYEERSP
jgi:probable rRNA maturation factor